MRKSNLVAGGLSTLCLVAWIAVFVVLLESSQVSLESRALTVGLMTFVAIPIGSITTLPFLLEWQVLKRTLEFGSSRAFWIVLAANVGPALLIIFLFPAVVFGAPVTALITNPLEVATSVLRLMSVNLGLLAFGTGVGFTGQLGPIAIGILFSTGFHSIVEAPFVLRQSPKSARRTLISLVAANLCASILALCIVVPICLAIETA